MWVRRRKLDQAGLCREEASFCSKRNASYDWGFRQAPSLHHREDGLEGDEMEGCVPAMVLVEPSGGSH